MTDTFKVLGQAAPAALTLTTLYTAPSQAVSSSLVICNRDAGTATFRVSVAVAGVALNVKQYLVFDAPIPGNDTIDMTLGATLGAADLVRVYASTALLSFTLFGEEIT